MSIDPNLFRQAMRQWASGVCIVTAIDSNGARQGMTVSSFISASLQPPLVVVSLEQTSRTQRAALESGYFAITLLSQEQQFLADCFAGRTCEDDSRFVGLPLHTLVSGAPLFTGGLVYLDCQVVATHPVGTHTLFIGEVIALESGTEQAPLLYYNRDYRAFQAQGLVQR